MLLAFLNIATVGDTDQPSNMPEGFTVGPEDYVPLMGGHAWSPEQEPASGLEWNDPIWVMGPFDGTVIFSESMVPLTFITGAEDKTFSETLTYEEQTIPELPSVHMVEYNGATGYATLTVKGTKAPKSSKKGNKKKSSKDDKKKKSKKSKN